MEIGITRKPEVNTHMNNKKTYQYPFVSVIIPCLNEEAYIGQCLDSIVINDYPKDRLEILIVDGISRDKTRKIVEAYIPLYPFIRLLDNRKKSAPAALNIGIKHSKGEIIVRMDAHSTYEKYYISKCVSYLNDYDADNVGGIWITVPRNNSLFAQAIAFSLSHRFGVGNAHYRIGQSKMPAWVDTVPFGCFRRSIFDKIGLFDENLPRDEDIEFNNRLRNSGGKILLVPEITINYYARSNFQSMCKHIFDNGLKITYPLKIDRMIFSCRHLIPLIFVSSLLISFGLWHLSNLLGFLEFLGNLSSLLFMFIIGLYFLSNSYFSLQIARREKDVRLLFLMPIIFTTLHFTYGFGSIWGLIRTILSKKKLDKSDTK